MPRRTVNSCNLKNISSNCRTFFYHRIMIERDIGPLLQQLAGKYPLITLTRPRQSGKTTLAKSLFSEKPYVTLEDPDTRRFAADDSRGFLAQYMQGAILDEIQRAPEVASYLQGMVDAAPQPGRFILTRSHQFELMSQVSQSLAGRTAVLRLLPFTLAEVRRLRGGVADPDLPQILLTGFYPRIHDQDLDPSQALADYFATYVQRDLRQLAAVQDLHRFERFVRLCAGRTGQLLNLSNLGYDAGVSHATARAWIDLLQTSYIVHLLPPWFTNTGKRLVKAPKLYFYDVGLACWLLGLRTAEQLDRDPLWGNLFENFVIMKAMKDRLNDGATAEVYFYRDSEANEVDLLLPTGGRMHAIEIKAGATVNPDYFKGLKTFAAITQRRSPVVAWCLVVRKVKAAATGRCIPGVNCRSRLSADALVGAGRRGCCGRVRPGSPLVALRRAGRSRQSEHAIKAPGEGKGVDKKEDVHAQIDHERAHIADIEPPRRHRQQHQQKADLESHRMQHATAQASTARQTPRLPALEQCVVAEIPAHREDRGKDRQRAGTFDAAVADAEKTQRAAGECDGLVDADVNNSALDALQGHAGIHRRFALGARGRAAAARIVAAYRPHGTSRNIPERQDRKRFLRGTRRCPGSPATATWQLRESWVSTNSSSPPRWRASGGFPWQPGSSGRAPAPSTG